MDYNISHCYNDEKDCWDIDVSGEIDISNSGEFKETLLDLIKEREKNICISCKNLDYIDSTALGALVAVMKNVKKFGGSVRIADAKPNIIKLFKITNLDKVFILEG